MALILNIETSTDVCSVALSRDGQILFSEVDKEGPSHAKLIGPFIDKALKVAENLELKPDAISVSSGPGSYTGLRIGVSIAKGVCYALGIPLISIPTLDLLSDMFINSIEHSENILIRPVLDARRMEVYTGLYNGKGICIESAKALIVNESSFEAELTEKLVYFVGNGSAKLRNVLHSQNARFVDELKPLAEAMVKLAEVSYNKSNFVDVAYFEPFYLKEFVATVSKKNVIPEK